VQLLIFELHSPNDHVWLESAADLGPLVLHELILPWWAKLKLATMRAVLSLGDWVWTILRLVV